jgi:DNA-nicking Smr family endonuclease
MSGKRKKKLSEVSASDSTLFRHAVSEAKPLAKSDPLPRIGPQSPATTHRTAPSDLPDGITDKEGYLFYRPGVQKRTLKNLKRGRPVPTTEIDLHGCTRRETLDYLRTFFFECLSEQINCVRIITGKGQRSPGRRSVIRETTLAWLRQQPQVLAYCTAPSNEGGTGAFYVLLSP